MKKAAIALLFLSHVCLAQDWQVDGMAGIAMYSGDLSTSDYSFRHVRPALNLNLKYRIDDHFSVRGGVSYGRIGANDRDNPDSSFRRRNLNFTTNILEFSIALEYNLLTPELFDFYPYVFVGVGGFHFDPFSYDQQNKKIYLKPLSTEGEGLPEYPDRKGYSLNQLCIPFGVGVKKTIDSRITLAFELGFRKIFTDYLDDVSKTYVDYDILLREKGPKAVEMAFRDLHGVMPAGHVRGSAKRDDWYYLTGFKIIYTLGTK